jgi:peptidoglycan/LPS O-acetylase OafA/YrhL
LAVSEIQAQRLPQIDMVKGWAILGVTVIHSWVLADSRWMTFLFYHSVPIFLVLFGVNSEGWFARRAPEGRVADWYLRAFKRILIPAWATALVWWAMVAILTPPEPMVRITLGLPFWHLIGWFKQIGASWFVSLILQFVILFPAFYWIRRKFGFAVLLGLAFLLTLPVTMYPLELKKVLTDGGWLIFAPRFALHIAFGMWLAARVDAIGWRSIAAAALVLIPLYTIEDRLWLLPWWRVADRLLELPLTVLLLATMSGLSGIRRLERPLSWLGRHSWGLYLGQILTHNAFLYRFGGACNLYGCVGGVFENFNLWLYTGILLAGSIVFVHFGNWLVTRNQRLRAAGWPLLDLDL